MGRTSVCEKTGLRKGAWSPEEDKVLKTYITNNGHGNWNELPKLAGLLRCGKSCRLRWKNYLDPIVERGNFKKEEVDFIIEMHKLGHRWSKIASHLPRRTDNEIKNFYYTKLKKKDKDNDTPIRERPKPKPAGKEFNIGEIQSSSIPILESYSMQPIPPQISGSSSSQPISSQTSSHSSSSIDRSINENQFLKEPDRETLEQIYIRVWKEGLSEDPHIPVHPSKEQKEQTYPWDCDNEYDIQREPLLKIHGRVWEENLREDPVLEEQTSPWSSVNDYNNLTRCKFQIDSSSFPDESQNESSIPEETERGALKQVYECVRTAAMWVGSLFGFNKINCR